MIQVLDCTLRDGGHVNNGSFSDMEVSGIVGYLDKAKVDFIEVGQLGRQFESRELGTFRSSFKPILEKLAPTENSKIVGMVRPDWISAKDVEDASPILSHLRIAFRKKDIGILRDEVKAYVDKGFQVSLNPVDSPSYSVLEMDKIIALANSEGVWALSFVDTYGVLTPDVFREAIRLLDENLDSSCSVGFHLHDNLLLTSSFLFEAIEYSKAKFGRSFLVDASVLGLGRAPGNLKLELACFILNRFKGKQYDLSSISEAMDQFVRQISDKHNFSYRPEYVFSAMLQLDRSFAEYFVEQEGMSVTQCLAELQAVADAGGRDFDGESPVFEKGGQ
jgi:4-hydroxy 2-oxovalerate aldolase